MIRILGAILYLSGVLLSNRLYQDRFWLGPWQNMYLSLILLSAIIVGAGWIVGGTSR